MIDGTDGIRTPAQLRRLIFMMMMIDPSGTRGEAMRGTRVGWQRGLVLVLVLVLVIVLARGEGLRAAQLGASYGKWQDRLLPYRDSVQNAPVAKGKIKVWHLHIAKTGGKTFRLAFPKIAGLRDSRLQPCCVGVSKLKGMFQTFGNNPGMEFFSHEAPITTVIDWLPKDAFVLTFVREPVSHVLSAIGHINHWTNGGFKVTKWENMLRRGNFNHYNTTNHMSSYLGGIHAMANLEPRRGLIVGVLELYPESICVFLHEIGRFDHKRCRCGPHGEPPDFRTGFMQDGNTEITNPRMRASFSQVKLMRSINRIDNQLYLRAVRLLLQRIRTVEAATGARFFCRGTLRSEVQVNEDV